MKKVLIAITLILFAFIEKADARRSHVWFVEKVDPSLIESKPYIERKVQKTEEMKVKKEQVSPKKLVKVKKF